MPIQKIGPFEYQRFAPTLPELTAEGLDRHSHHIAIAGGGPVGLLTALGLDECILAGRQELVEYAVRLGNDGQERARLRQRLCGRLPGARLFDPKAMDNARKAFPTLNYAFSSVEACTGVDAVLVLTEWDEFRNLRPEDLAGVTRSNHVIDARNCLEPAAWRAAGWTYRGFGRQ